MKKSFRYNNKIYNFELMEPSDSKNGLIQVKVNDKLVKIDKINGSIMKDPEDNLNYFFQIEGKNGILSEVNDVIGKTKIKSENNKINSQGDGHNQIGNENNEIIAPMPGKIFKINVKNKQEVNQGTTLIILEAMKMEHSLKSSINGYVSEIYVNENELVKEGQVLIKLQSNQVKESQ